MSNITTINTFQFLVDAAVAAMGSRRSDKGLRPKAVRAFLEAATAEQREEAVAEWGAGFVRRGLHEQAKFFKADEEIANVFESLRDSISLDGDVDEDIEIEDAILDVAA